MQCHHVKVVVVGRRVGISGGHAQEVAQPGGVVPVGPAGQVDDRPRVFFLGHQIGHLEQLEVVGRRAAELVAVDARLDLRLIPDDPVVNPKRRVVLDHLAHVARPQVVGIIDRQVEAAGHAGEGRTIGGPGGRVLQQAHDHAVLRRGLHQPLLQHVERVPVVGAGGLNLIPVEEDAVPTDGQRRGLLRLPERLDDAEARVNGCGFFFLGRRRSRHPEQQQGQGRQQQPTPISLKTHIPYRQKAIHAEVQTGDYNPLDERNQWTHP